MKALSYLIINRMKNRILSLKKKPGMLIFYSIIIVIMIFSTVMMIVSGNEMGRQHLGDERILFLIIAGLGLLYLVMFTSTGLSTGSSLFTMPDVGLLFVAPISSKKILMYGLLNTLGKSLLGSIFIFYQVGNLKSSFGYGFKEIFTLFLVFALMVVFCQLLSIGIYIFANGNQMRKNMVKTILYSLFAILAVAVLFIQKSEHVNILEAVLSLADTKWFGYVPVAGWTMMLFVGVVKGSLSMILIPSALYLVIGVVVIFLLTSGKADYYEDVLLSTETTFQALSAAKEGRMVTAKRNKKIKIKEDDTGIGRGSGAMTLAYKHILELRRNSKFIFVDSYTIFITAMAGVAGYYFKTKDAPSVAVYGVLGVAVYIQFIMTMMGKLKNELIKPYIYLIPEKSIKKVFAASVTSLIKPCVDGILIFGVLAMLSGAVATCLFSAFAYAASGAVFVGMTILYQRVLGGQPSKIAQIMISLGLLLAIMTPAIGVSVAAAILLPQSLNFLCSLPYTMFCLLFAALMFVTCGNLIDKAEYTGRF